jgi:hypothetical protein
MNLAMPNIRQFAAMTPQRYGGTQVVGFNPAQRDAQNMALGAAGTQNQLAGNAAGALQQFFTPEFWNPENNTMLQGAINAATRPIMQSFREETLPGLRGEAVSTGNFGSSRQGIAEGVAGGRAAQAVGDTAAKLAQSTYDTNTRAVLQAAGLLPTVQDAQLAGARTTGAVGDVRQALQQARRNEDVQNFMFDQYAPFMQSQEIMRLLAGLPGGTNVTTGTGPTTGPTQLLGGGLAGMQLGTALGGPVGGGLGALGGALLPLLW